MDNKDVPVMILCGGMGTRLREASEKLPKPLVDIGGKPILWHIMKLYGSHGYRRFVLCLGYKSELIKRYFLDYQAEVSDFTLHMGDGPPAGVPQLARAGGLGGHLRRDRAAQRHGRPHPPGRSLPRRREDVHAHLR